MIALLPGHREAIHVHARAAYPEECCGALLGREDGAVPRVVRVRVLDNDHHGERRRRFLVRPQDYLAVEREAAARGLVLLGFYHSHPDHPAQPSEHDLAQAWPHLHYLILAIADGEPGELTSWVLAPDRRTMRPERLLVESPVLARIQT